jgi:hypothetical protein
VLGASSAPCVRALQAFASFRLVRGFGTGSLNEVVEPALALCWDAMARDSLVQTEEAVMRLEWRDLENVLADVLRYV